jgi:6-pyruvoyl-tetrahydropterin synthase
MSVENNIKQEQGGVISDYNELASIQEELINRGDGKYIRPEKPNDAKYTRRELTRDMAICLVFVYKHFRYTEGVNQTDYFPKRILLQYLSQFPNITRNFHRLKYWDLICQMPTSPTEVIYKKGWYGLTEHGIGFIQKEIGMPKYAFIWNDFAYEHQTNPYVMITDLIKEDELEELLKP